MFTKIEPERVSLMDAFKSYDDEASLRAQLAESGFSPERRLLKKAASDRYPPREMVTLTVGNFRHMSELGMLSLELFNDRLMEAEFHPEDAAAYAKALHRANPELRPDSTGTAELDNGNLHIYSNVDLARSRVGGSLGTDALVLWQDQRLITQRDEWDARFGAIQESAHR